MINREELREDVTIGDKVYQVMPLGAFDAMVAFLKFVQIVGPTVGKVLDNESEKEYILPQDKNMISTAVLLLCEQMHRADVVGLFRKITEDIKDQDGRKVDVDTEFQGNFGDFLLLIEFAVRLNFEKAFIDWFSKKGFTMEMVKEKVQALGGHLLNSSKEELNEK